MDSIDASGLLVPLDWVVVDDPGLGVVAAVAPRKRPASGFRPSVVVTRGSEAEPLAAFAGLDPVVEDHDDYETKLGPAHYLRVAWTAARVEMLAEIWWWERDDDVLTLTARMTRADYADYSDVVEGVADTFLPAA